MSWILTGLFLSVAAPYIAMSLACGFMMVLRTRISEKLSPRLPFLAAHPHRLNPLRPAVRFVLKRAALGVEASRSLLPGFLAGFHDGLLRKIVSWQGANQGPPMPAVLANIGRLLWLGSIGAMLAIVAIGVPYGVGFWFVRMAANSAQQYLVQGMAIGLFSAVILAAVAGFSTVASGASKIAKSPRLLELRRISRSSGKISSASLREASIAIYSHSLLRLGPFFFTYAYGASFLLVAGDTFGFAKIRADLFQGLPAVAVACIVIASVVLCFLAASKKVRAVKRQMEPTRALVALLGQTSPSGEIEQRYGYYSPIPDPLGPWRYGWASLAQKLDSSAMSVAPELRELSAPHPLSRILEDLAGAVRGILTGPVPSGSDLAKDVRSVLELVVCCLAEPRNPDLLHAADVAVANLKDGRLEEKLSPVRRGFWSTRRFTTFFDLIDGPTKTFNAVVAMSTIALALYAAIKAGDVAGLAKLVSK
ncbi:hypothetical protein F6X68_10315 [Micromonospora sp. AMSO12t]|uniref:hypothetical protein n=1 Tax=Micromonospora sp. AMSO12t TaxID=2650410 RepID=UPI00124B5B44|nr:hypothetical protein [Micromonospora sp. AMSO12t]KAB1158770.1 hypothetical protein F6X68_10315 [Micromonospora sp. AMSO12t]